MKQKIKVIDKKSGKVFEKEYTLRNLDHFEIQKKTRANVFEDRRFKKPKHKKRFEDD